ncbi:cyanate hydratase [Mycobacterium xenopi 4042]|uniref:Cyanate hydratase n=1 Tax=Mycobacterium xenopi 4042 TaxID=1299334 RepID=X7YJP8_MYCXE|nr:cyanate hydratase [Mycobacterium xenopi 4042]
MHPETHESKRDHRTNRGGPLGKGSVLAGTRRRDRQTGGLDHLGAAGSAADPGRARQGARGDAGLDQSVVPVLAAPPMRGGLPTAVPTDPTIYRFYEALQVYGPAIKELIHEQFGDGIMSAINFSVDVQKKPHPSGDRVVVTFDGKFLPYEWVAAES